jgi:predicted nucleic acid-binding protein
VEGIISLLPILSFDLEAARIHARIGAKLRSQGLTIGSHDLMIAATALCHGLTVMTGNEREFRRVDGLAVRTS